MFQSTKRQAAKEQEQEFQRLKEKQENYIQAAERIEDNCDKAMDMMDELLEEQDSFDKALTQVVENIRQLQNIHEEQTENGQQLSHRMEQVSDGLDKAERLHQELVTEVKSREEDLVALTEQNKHFTNPSRFMNQSVKELEGDLCQLEEHLTQMKDYSHKMGVLSLNAAIEAGRMGEGGRQFISAAEEVRSCAGKYQEETLEMLQQMEQMKQKIAETQEQMAHLTGLLKENNVMLGKTLRAFQGCSSRMEEEGNYLQAEECREIRQIWKQNMESENKNGIYFEQTLQAMELAGESFMKEQQFLEQMKEQMKRAQLEIQKNLLK